MTKKDEQKTNLLGRVKFRYADTERYFDLDVDNIKNETGVVDGLKSIASALAGRTAMAANRALVTKPTNGATNGAASAAAATAAEEEEATEGEVLDTEIETSDSAANGNGTTKIRKKQVPKAPNFLSTLDMATAPVSLEDFAKTKNPTGVNDRYLVVATWFKEQMKLDEINIDHIFTAFRTLDWQTPDDLSSTFRTLKHSKQYFDKGDSVGGYKVTFLATNYVAKIGTAKL